MTDKDDEKPEFPDDFGFSGQAEEAMRRYHLRRALLDPACGPQRVVHYVVAMGRVELHGGEVVLKKEVAAPFRPQRIIIRAIFAPLPPWIVFLAKWFSWVVVPWFAVEWDDYLERDALRLCFTRPAKDLYKWADTRVQRLALRDANLVSVKVQGAEALVNPISATLFVAMPVRLELPTVSPGQAIEVVFAGTGGPFDVVIQGTSLE